MRTIITPGRLYSKLSSDFRKVCCERCAQCVFPVPYTAADGTWQLGDLPRECEECAQQISTIVRRHQALYDLLDPFSPRVMARHLEPSRPTRH
jgi:hypothetical protein